MQAARKANMKPGIHPEYKPAKVVCACGNVVETRSVRGDFHIEICSQCHPFFTGKQKIMDTAGRIEKFRTRYAAQSAAAAVPPAKKLEPVKPAAKAEACQGEPRRQAGQGGQDQGQVRGRSGARGQGRGEARVERQAPSRRLQAAQARVWHPRPWSGSSGGGRPGRGSGSTRS